MFLKPIPLFVAIKPLPYVYPPSVIPPSPMQFVSPCSNTLIPIIPHAPIYYPVPQPIFPVIFLRPVNFVSYIPVVSAFNPKISPVSVGPIAAPKLPSSSQRKPQFNSRKNLLYSFQKTEMSSTSAQNKEVAKPLYKKHSRVSRKKIMLDKDLLDAVRTAFDGDIANVKIPRGESEKVKTICKILNFQYNESNESNRLRIYKGWEKLKISISSAKEESPSVEINDERLLKSSDIVLML